MTQIRNCEITKTGELRKTLRVVAIHFTGNPIYVFFIYRDFPQIPHVYHAGRFISAFRCISVGLWHRSSYSCLARVPDLDTATRRQYLLHESRGQHIYQCHLLLQDYTL